MYTTNPLRDYAAHDARCLAVSTAHQQAYITLKWELVSALLTNPAVRVRTPAWGRKQALSPAFEVIADRMSGVDADNDWLELLGIVSGVAQGQDVRARAAKFLEEAAERYAAFHASDASEEV